MTEDYDYMESSDIADQQKDCFLSELELRNICQAKCDDFRIKMTPKLLERFQKHHMEKKLRKTFEMEASGIGPLAMEVLGEVVSRHPNIRVLKLSGNPLGDDGAFAVADLLERSKKVISVDISSCAMEDAGLRSLFRSLRNNTSVIDLHVGSHIGMHRNSIGSSSATALGSMLNENKVLSELDLSMVELTSEKIELMTAEMHANHTIQVLSLPNNSMRSKGAILLMNRFMSSGLVELNLSGNHLKDDIGPHVANFLSQSNSLKVLNLSSNLLGQRFAAALVEPLSNPSSMCSLEVLDISKNPFTGRGIAALGPGMAKNKTIRTLNITGCKINPSGFNEFCRDLSQNERLESLIMSHNPIRDEGAKHLARFVKDHIKISELEAEICEISDDGAKALFGSIETSETLTKVSIKGNLIRDGFCIQRAISKNKRIHSLNIEYNDIDYKVFESIQKQTSSNFKEWKDRQSTKTPEDIEMMKKISDDLNSTRHMILETRKQISDMKNQVEFMTRQRDEVEKHKHDTINTLEKQLEDITISARETYNKNHDETDQTSSMVSQMETDANALSMKLAREAERFRADNKNMTNVQRQIDDKKSEMAKFEEEWHLRMKDTKEKYLDAVRGLQMAFSMAKSGPPPEIDTEDSSAKPLSAKKSVKSAKSAKSKKSKAKSGRSKTKAEEKPSSRATEADAPANAAAHESQ